MGYEYKDVTVPWVRAFGTSPARLVIQNEHGPGYTIEVAKEECWQADQSAILKVLSAWFDQGWEPVETLGPEGVELSVHVMDRSELEYVLGIIYQ